MYILENGTDTLRLGVSVSKKVGNSIVRHRLARLIREAFRLNNDNVKRGLDIVVVAINMLYLLIKEEATVIITRHVQSMQKRQLLNMVHLRVDLWH